MTNKLVVIINNLKVPKIKKLLLYEMKFIVPNYSCLQNPWLAGYRPQNPVLSVLCPQLNLLNPPPRTKFLGTPLYGRLPSDGGYRKLEMGRYNTGTCDSRGCHGVLWPVTPQTESNRRFRWTYGRRQSRQVWDEWKRERMYLDDGGSTFLRNVGRAVDSWFESQWK